MGALKDVLWSLPLTSLAGKPEATLAGWPSPGCALGEMQRTRGMPSALPTFALDCLLVSRRGLPRSTAPPFLSTWLPFKAAAAMALPAGMVTRVLLECGSFSGPQPFSPNLLGALPEGKKPLVLAASLPTPESEPKDHPTTPVPTGAVTLLSICSPGAKLLWKMDQQMCPRNCVHMCVHVLASPPLRPTHPWDGLTPSLPPIPLAPKRGPRWLTLIYEKVKRIQGDTLVCCWARFSPPALDGSGIALGPPASAPQLCSDFPTQTPTVPTDTPSLCTAVHVPWLPLNPVASRIIPGFFK